MTRPTPLALAQAAYAAYGEWTGGLNHRGEPMPRWDDLGETIQHAWIAAAGAVERAVLTSPRDIPASDPERR